MSTPERKKLVKAWKKYRRIKKAPVGDVRVGKTGRIRLTGKAMEQLRSDCFERDDYQCRVCGVAVSWAGVIAPQGQMAHIKSRGAGGSDTLDNVRTLCPECHTKSHNAGGKPCPKKPKLSLEQRRKQCGL